MLGAFITVPDVVAIPTIKLFCCYLMTVIFMNCTVSNWYVGDLVRDPRGVAIHRLRTSTVWMDRAVMVQGPQGIRNGCSESKCSPSQSPNPRKSPGMPARFLLLLCDLRKVHSFSSCSPSSSSFSSSSYSLFFLLFTLPSFFSFLPCKTNNNIRS